MISKNIYSICWHIYIAFHILYTCWYKYPFNKFFYAHAHIPTRRFTIFNSLFNSLEKHNQNEVDSRCKNWKFNTLMSLFFAGTIFLRISRFWVSSAKFNSLKIANKSDLCIQKLINRTICKCTYWFAPPPPISRQIYQSFKEFKDL